MANLHNCLTADTIQRCAIHSVFAVTGWHAVYWEDDRHVVQPVHVLALVTRRTYDRHTGKLLTVFPGTPEDELRDLEGMHHFSDGGWNVCCDISTYCGLLAPGKALVDFEQDCCPKSRHHLQHA